MKSSFPLVLLLALLAVGGCKANSSSQSHHIAQTGKGASSRNSPANKDAANSTFDYYAFYLSWSPKFCLTHNYDPECSARPGFIVEGLWPKKNDGTSPENCSNPAAPSNPSAYLNLIADPTILNSIWNVHGSCSGLSADAYFANVSTALQSFEIPATFAAARNPPAKIEPRILLDQLHNDNPGFPTSSFAISCDNNSLTALQVCFDKSLAPTACKGIQACGAKEINIPAAQ
jgi:ribonuclease T2